VVQGHPTITGKDWVLVEWTGVVRCPWHGELAPEQEYVPGPALCGCEFQTLPSGVLRAVKAAELAPVLQTGGENAG